MRYTYISHSRTPKTYYGITFCYGDKKEVRGRIDDKRFVFCGSRPNPPTSVVATSNEVVLTNPHDEQSTPVADDVPAEKPKSTRGRKPKVAEAVFEEPTSDAE